MSVDERSNFSYHVAAGKTTSLSSVEDVMRKSAETSRSSFPSGASSRQRTSCGLDSAWSSPRTLLLVPSRCLRKYSSPFAEEPNRLERHSTRVRGQFSGASGSSTAKLSSPLLSLSAIHSGSDAASPRSTPAIAASATSSEFSWNCG